ncbi:MAG: hypothetical protein ACMXYG_07705, partial [Candidatus Woesearchaeota archaeon]
MMEKEVSLLNIIIFVSVLLMFLPFSFGYQWVHRLESLENCGGFSAGEGLTCPSSLRIFYRAPGESDRPFGGSGISLNCPEEFEGRCSSPDQGRTHWETGNNELHAASLDHVCASSRKEGNYVFTLDAGIHGRCVTEGTIVPPLLVRWDLYEPWCVQASCGRGDWLGSSIVSNNCCSPRTMNLADHTYTNEDCNVIIGDNLCYFRENATLVEPSTAGRWLKASDFTGEIVYEECGKTALNRNDGYEYVSTGSNWVICDGPKI